MGRRMRSGEERSERCNKGVEGGEEEEGERRGLRSVIMIAYELAQPPS